MKSLTSKSLFSLILFVYAFFISCNYTKDPGKNKLIIELVGSTFDKVEIQSIAKANGATDIQLYQWNNHLVLYTHLDQVEAFSKQITGQFPELRLKIYDNPFYNFSKAERCPDSSVTDEWEHILLTANLVENKKYQQEYLDYHRTQFEEWPEISEGFCNADFQQLLLYRNGRQLMLVISIPANKTLDELNPKTVENNPRMDEWNRIMDKYQEGIEGTKPGEKWVSLDKVK
jgi:hypothetical protein